MFIELGATQEISTLLSSIPQEPGVYQFLNSEHRVIYVGKATNLRNRIRSYFSGRATGKTLRMVKSIRCIRITVVCNEIDAFLLENNLIKQFQPKYNILLKDDKTYPWLCIKNEPFPRVFLTRKKVDDGSKYFGPYPSVKVAKNLLHLIQELYPIRSCSLDLREEKIKQGKYSVCLEYHIGNCLGPCVGKQNEEDYQKNIQRVEDLIKGEYRLVQKMLEQDMLRYAEKLEFEKAQQLKEKIELLTKHHSKSLVAHPSIGNVNVFGVAQSSQRLYVHFFNIVDGAIIQSFVTEVQQPLEEESVEEVLRQLIFDFRLQGISTAKEIITAYDLNIEGGDFHFVVPKIGDKKKLLELSEKNALQYRLQKEKQLELLDPQQHTQRMLEEMRIALRMKEPPVHIECFDNSNIQGAYPVSSCVVFKNGKPSKRDYRLFHIKTVVGPNDFASMEEVIYRRYKRMLEEGQSLPQLIIVDGGKGQLSSAAKSLNELGILSKVTLIGIAKRLEEIYFHNDPYPLHLDKTSIALRIIQQARDEAHRFSNTFHQKSRNKRTFTSQILHIPGIGEKSTQLLLKCFHSPAKVATASLEELEQVLGKSRARLVYAYFHEKD